MSYRKKTIFSDHFISLVLITVCGTQPRWEELGPLQMKSLNHCKRGTLKWGDSGACGPRLHKHTTWREQVSVHLLEHLVRNKWRRGAERRLLSLLSLKSQGCTQVLGQNWKIWSLRQWEAAQDETHLGSGRHIFPLEKGAYRVALQWSKAESYTWLCMWSSVLLAKLQHHDLQPSLVPGSQKTIPGSNTILKRGNKMQNKEAGH